MYEAIHSQEALPVTALVSRTHPYAGLRTQCAAALNLWACLGAHHEASIGLQCEDARMIERSNASMQACERVCGEAGTDHLGEDLLKALVKALLRGDDGIEAENEFGAQLARHRVLEIQVAPQSVHSTPYSPAIPTSPPPKSLLSLPELQGLDGCATKGLDRC